MIEIIECNIRVLLVLLTNWFLLRIRYIDKSLFLIILTDILAKKSKIAMQAI